MYVLEPTQFIQVAMKIYHIILLVLIGNSNHNNTTNDNLPIIL